jgi:hypothetical protein
MRVYIAGPMTGHPLWNFPAFDQASQELRAYGYTPVNPADLDRAVGFDPARDTPSPTFLREALARDMVAICGCRAVAVLPGWKKSLGALVEVSLAVRLGLTILDAETLDDITREATDHIRRQLCD